MAVPQSNVPAIAELQCEQLNPFRETNKLSLPRCLPRPVFRSIPPETIAAIDPALTDLPLGYILHNLEKDIGPRLFQAARATQVIPPNGPLSSEMTVKCNSHLEPPTHILAIHSKQQKDLYTLYPSHALIISTGCAHLPPLPRSSIIPPGAATSQLTLPVASLSIPSPAMFHPILNFLYLRHVNVILDVLLPIEDNPLVSVKEWSRKQAKQFSGKELLLNSRKIWGLWANASALGIFDDRLFTIIELAWEVCIGALESTNPQT